MESWLVLARRISTTAMLSDLTNTCLVAQCGPHSAAASTMGTSSLMVMLILAH